MARYRFQINNAKHSFALTTNPVSVGLDAAGTGATANMVSVSLQWDIATGDIVTFQQQIELKRKDIGSTKWKR